MDAQRQTALPQPTVSGSDAFAHWREVVCRHFTRLSPELLATLDSGDKAFRGHIDQIASTDGASLSKISATAQRVSRTRSDIAASPCDAVFLNVQLKGRSVVRQREVETVLPVGSMTLLDARQPFDMRFDGAFQQMCFHLPFAWFEAAELDPTLWLARRASVRTPEGMTLMKRGGAWLEAGLSDSADPASPIIDGEEADALPTAASLLSLIDAVFTGRAPTLGDSYAALIQDFVQAQAGRRDLSPTSVARHFRISPRYVHRLFARSGTTFGTFLRQTRVAAARVLLQSRPDLAVTEVGSRCGFADLPAFSRAFRRETGESPRAFRQRLSARSN